MFGTTGGGWLCSLADEQRFHDEESDWGSVDGFLSSVDSAPKRKGRIIVESRVWGRMQSTEFNPTRGDGFAFYHSSRAVFPQGDPHRKKARVSAIGELLEIRLDGRDLQWLKVAIDPEALESFRRSPIVRDDANRGLFEKCGIVRGAVATLYHAPAQTWEKLVSLQAKADATR